MTEVVTMKKKKPIVYTKPNITNLKGKIGRSIIETIRNTPRPDFTEIDKECDRIGELLLHSDTKCED